MVIGDLFEIPDFDFRVRGQRYEIHDQRTLFAADGLIGTNVYPWTIFRAHCA